MARTITMLRPVTFPLLAAVLGVKPFQLLADLIRMEQFPTPFSVLDDSVAIELAAMRDVELRIAGDAGEAKQFLN
ncbi:MAG: hypothetical protein EOP88_00005 [Verrucomicrobiaceae bacterium]|nr:MAG: hypothetical protein EOP88_00005 [Verrucomicrobiaceae bacterium]